MKGRWICLSWKEPRLTLSPPHVLVFPLYHSFLWEWGWGACGGQVREGESEVDNRYHHAHTHTHPSETHQPGTHLFPLPPPQNIFISIIEQFFYMLIHQSGLALICRRGAGWCVPLPLFRCAPLPGRHLSRYVAHKAPALSALIDQRPAVKKESSTPYQWCSTSAPEKSLRLLPQHAQCRR